MIRRRTLKRPKFGINYNAIAAAGGIGKGPSIQLEKGWKQKAFEKALAAAYEEVNIRDDNRSRVTGRQLFAKTANLEALREHNHLGKRATHPSEKVSVKNIFLVSHTEHRYLTNNELLIHGKNANKELRFYWNPNVFKPGMPVPFRIPAAYRYEPGKAKAA